MDPAFERLGILIGEDGLARLAASRVLVAGLGGVGSFCAEALVRCGVGSIEAVDFDRSEPSNLNRQLLATQRTLGELKTESFVRRAREIHPAVQAKGFAMRLNRDTFDSLDLGRYHVVADCIDSLVPKLNLILSCLEQEIPVIASTGGGFKKDPTQVRAGSIWETRHDPLAYRMRKKLRQWGHGDKDLRVVYSLEKRPPELKGASAIGSMVTVTGTFGLVVASEVIRELLSSV